ncbi:MAG: hypothetical protein ABI282_01630 [Candidatus Baltobacteraceae bacterium]
MLNIREHDMRIAIYALVLTIASGSVAAAATSSAIATVYQFVTGLNNGETKAALAACATPSSIVDDFPPHEWQGPTACADWARDFGANNTKHGITGGIVTLAKPWHVDVSGDRAYVVVPATYTYNVHGKPVTESGSILTVALRKISDTWKITGWAWAKR